MVTKFCHNGCGALREWLWSFVRIVLEIFVRMVVELCENGCGEFVRMVVMIGEKSCGYFRE